MTTLANPKQIVQDAYDSIAEWYLQWLTDTQQHTPRERHAELVLANAHALVRRQAGQSSSSPPPQPRILELGCGPGVPITRLLLDRGAAVVANDISSTQIQMARARVSRGRVRGGGHGGADPPLGQLRRGDELLRRLPPAAGGAAGISCAGARVVAGGGGVCAEPGDAGCGGGAWGDVGVWDVLE
ncbi:hypothetical protein MRB53_037731 [Persea americana]|nr:hypothetical protein MRB53_037731 [Persea americana]